MPPSLEEIVEGLKIIVERKHEFRPGERDLLIAAAEQLVELSNLLGAEKSANNYLSFKIDCYSKDICKVAAERDEARRSVCCQALPSDYKAWSQSAVDSALKLIAAQQGWDCFGGGTNG